MVVKTVGVEDFFERSLRACFSEIILVLPPLSSRTLSVWGFGVPLRVLTRAKVMGARLTVFLLLWEPVPRRNCEMTCDSSVQPMD